MASTKAPSTMRAWQFSSARGGIEHNLKLNPSAPLPTRKADQHLIQVLAVSLNPVDFKPVEMPLVARLLLPKPAVPVIDFCGKIVQPADNTNLQAGQIVFGNAGVHALGGALAEYTVAKEGTVAVLPSGLSVNAAASICIAGSTAYQSIVPYIKKGSSVFINGGSGGTGVFGIQIAKAKGCHVATTCSTGNVELCRSLGADQVIDYKTQNIVETLKSSGTKFDHVVDNVGGDAQLYWKAHEYTNPKALYMTVGAKLTLGSFCEAFLMKVWPGFLGGGKRKAKGMFAKAIESDLSQIANYMVDGQVKPVFDSVFQFEDAIPAFEKIKTGHAKGKVVIEIAPEATKA